MTIKINEKVIDKLVEQGFYPNEMFSLFFCLKALRDKRVELIDRYDDFNSSKRAVISYLTLLRKGFIERDSTDSVNHYRLTQKGSDLVESIDILSEESEVVTGGVKDWINEWLELFPVKAEKRLLRSDKKSCEIKMNNFIKTYKYDKEIIMSATKSYLMEESSDNFKYTKNAVYFIDKKGEGSALAGWCKLIKDKVDSGGVVDESMRVKLTQHVN